MRKIYTFAWRNTNAGTMGSWTEAEKFFTSLSKANTAAREHAGVTLDCELSKYHEPRNVNYTISQEGGLHVKVGDTFFRRYRIIERFLES